MAYSCQPSIPEEEVEESGSYLKITKKQLGQKEQADCSVRLGTKTLGAGGLWGHMYSLLQDLAVSGLRVAKVHELI